MSIRLSSAQVLRVTESVLRLVRRTEPAQLVEYRKDLAFHKYDIEDLVEEIIEIAIDEYAVRKYPMWIVRPNGDIERITPCAPNTVPTLNAQRSAKDS